MLGKKKRSVVEPRPLPPRPARLRVPVIMLFRMFVIGTVAVVASAYAIWRHYTVPPAPMLVPAPSSPAEIEIEQSP